jgi:hypothetical protein
MVRSTLTIFSESWLQWEGWGGVRGGPWQQKRGGDMNEYKGCGPGRP